MEMHGEKGFTLVEVLVTMAIGMVILAGMTSVFVSQTGTANMLNNKTEAMGDLFLASQIIPSELRGSKGVCWDTSNQNAKKLIYQPIDSNDSLIVCSGPTANNGSFEYRTTGVDGPRVCWDRPLDGGGCQELIRDLCGSGTCATPGMDAVAPVDPLTDTWRVILSSKYTGADKQTKNLDLAFKVWPRN